MSAVVIAYAPGAGGNHLKNLLCLESTFGNSPDLDSTVYSTATQPPGTVHSIPGRNVRADLIEKYCNNPDKTWIIHGHFGELAPYRSQINAIENKKFIVISIDSDQDRQLLTKRQERLGHRQHPYYINEEQPYLYKSEVYTSYFTATTPEDVCVIPLYEAWHPNLVESKIIARLNNFLNININIDTAQTLHNRWWELNFYFDFCNLTRRLYGQDSN